jgi:hypothetical protein
MIINKTNKTKIVIKIKIVNKSIKNFILDKSIKFSFTLTSFLFNQMIILKFKFESIETLLDRAVQPKSDKFSIKITIISYKLLFGCYTINQNLIKLSKF